MNAFEHTPSTKPVQAEMPPKQLTFTREELDAVLAKPDWKPAELINLLGQDFKDLFDAQVGVSERYSLRRHTLMVLGQYKKYFAAAGLPHQKLFEVMLALHDIGKPLAAAEEDTTKQHGHTLSILRPTLEQLNYSPEEIAIAEALVEGDPVGSYIKTQNLGPSVDSIIRSWKKTPLSIEEFWTMLITYYQSDAGSYTVDAGGVASLDRMFVFEPDDGIMSFAPRIHERVEALRAGVMARAGGAAS